MSKEIYDLYLKMGLSEKVLKMAEEAESGLQERFKKIDSIAEYNQLVIRYKGLRNMLDKWNKGELEFKPTCPRSTYNMQIKAMTDYIAVLEARAVMEGVEL